MPPSVLVWVALASAADLHVGTGRPYATLQAAVDAAATNDRVILHPGTYEGATSSKTLELVGAGGPAAVTVAGVLDVNGGSPTLRGLTLDGQGVRRPLDVSGGGTVTVEDAVLRDGLSATDGGCATVTSSTLVLRRTLVQDCAADHEGGGVYLSSADLVLEGATFRGNRVVAGRGGAVYGAGSAVQVTDQGSTWEDNLAADPTSDTANGFGGAVYLRDGADGTFLDATFAANEVTSARADGGIGGAVRGFGADLVLAGGRLVGNLAAERGTAVAANGGTASLSGLLVDGNVSTDPVLAPAYGGALFCEGGATCAVDQSWFSGNQAGDGAAIGALSALTVTRSGFCANRATENGGAIDVGNLTAGAVTLSANLFLNNTAVATGGALVVSDQTLTATHNTFAGNTAPSGSAIDWTSDGGTGLGPALSGNVFVRNAGPTGFAVELGPLLATEALGWFWDNAPADLDRPPATTTTVGVDPGLLPTDACDAAGSIPASGSPLIDADPTGTDPDGSAADLGFSGGPDADPDAFLDLDGDGFPAMVDCDDADPARHLGALETCGDGGDDDCDGLVDAADPDAQGAAWLHRDGDEDGLGDPAQAAFLCPTPGWVAGGEDCDDADPSLGLGGVWYADLDADGLGDPSAPIFACVRPPTAVSDATDCDDGQATVGRESTWALDADRDGHGALGSAVVDCFPPTADHAAVPADDCDDGDAQVRPGAVEQCNGRDDDCDGPIDEDVVEVDWWPDRDGDLYGDLSATPTRDCAAPGADWAPVAGDCDDGDAGVNPGAVEVCDGADQDCDALVDDDDPDVDLLTGTATWPDVDGDGFGDQDAAPERACAPGADRSTDPTDCDDGDPGVAPGAPEIPGDGIDQDCDGVDATEPVEPEPEPDRDTDGDGLTDDEEEALGTDPAAPDTDGDGALDGADLWPLDPSGADGAPLRPVSADYGFGCGCASGGPGAGAWLGLAGLLALRRRR